LTQRQLLTPDAIGKLIESWRIPDEMTAMLLDSSRRHSLAQEAARLLGRMVEASADRAMQQFMRQLATKTLQGVHFAPVIGQVLSGFLQSAQRDRLLNDALTLVSEAVETQRIQLSSLIADTGCPWPGCSILSGWTRRWLESSWTGSSRS
jgi:uncharacterized membrane-anchored protein YjiN (DUF445 family)